MKLTVSVPVVVLGLMLHAGLTGCGGPSEPSADRPADAAPAKAVEPDAPVAQPSPPVAGVWTGDFDGMKERRLVRMLVVYSKTFYFIDKATQRDGVEFNLASLSPTLPPHGKEEFSTAYMGKLYAAGKRQAEVGYSWHKYPPGYERPVIAYAPPK